MTEASVGNLGGSLFVRVVGKRSKWKEPEHSREVKDILH